MKKQFWAFVEKTDASGGPELTLDGEIASGESWWYDTVTPQLFKSQLKRCQGPLTIWLNSPGGDPFAASAIYTDLLEYKNGGKNKVTVKVKGIAASAASVIAMAADELLMSPTAYLMVHNPWTIALGDSRELSKVAGVLDEIRDGMVAAYMAKTGKSRTEIMEDLDNETYMNAASAVEKGYADGILYEGEQKDAPAKSQFSRSRAYALAIQAVKEHPKEGMEPEDAPEGQPLTPDPHAAKRREIAVRAMGLASDICN